LTQSWLPRQSVPRTVRVLWVKAGGFLPLDAGGKIRSYHTVKNIARHWTTTVITFYPEEREDQNPTLQGIVDKLITVPLRSRSRAAVYGAALLGSRPFMFERFCRPEVERAVAAELEDGKYDVVICDFVLACGVVPREVDATKIVFTHNVESRIWERHYKVAENFPRRLVAKREWRLLEDLEHRYLGEADAVLAVSEADRAEFVSWDIAPEKVFSVPTGVDTSFFEPQPEISQSGTLVFVGSMDWMPNQDGILFFLDEIYPLVQKKCPGVKLQVVGRRPPPRILEECSRHPSVSVTGWVKDIREYLAEADACVVPLRVGSGTRLKIFEAMAMGKAVISTTIGAEGLPVTDRKNILIADKAADFADGTVELLQDRVKREGLGKGARTLVEENYSWEAVTAEFMETISTINAKFGRRSSAS